MSNGTISLIQAVNAVNRSGSLRELSTESPLVSLDERLGNAIASKAVESQQMRDQIYAALNDPGVASDPAQLVEWQKKLAVYTLETNLCSTLVRKGVSAIETLIKT